MAMYLASDSEITSIADAIRTKGGTSSALVFPTDFVTAIQGIPTGTDVSDTTATAGDVLSGKDFYLANGTKTSGTIATKTSANLQVLGNTVTAPSGYYASNASASVSSGSVFVPATTITANPTVSASGGNIVTSVSASESVPPIVSAGYVSRGTEGTITVSGSSTVSATTLDANLVAGNIKDGETIFGVTGTYTGGGGGNVTITMQGSVAGMASAVKLPVGGTVVEDAGTGQIIVYITLPANSMFTIGTIPSVMNIQDASNVTYESKTIRSSKIFWIYVTDQDGSISVA